MGWRGRGQLRQTQTGKRQRHVTAAARRGVFVPGWRRGDDAHEDQTVSTSLVNLVDGCDCEA